MWKLGFNWFCIQAMDEHGTGEAEYSLVREDSVLRIPSQRNMLWRLCLEEKAKGWAERSHSGIQNQEERNLSR